MKLFLEIDTVSIKPIWKAIQVSIKYTGWGNKSYGHETSLGLLLRCYFFLFFFLDITKSFAISLQLNRSTRCLHLQGLLEKLIRKYSRSRVKICFYLSITFYQISLSYRSYFHIINYNG